MKIIPVLCKSLYPNKTVTSTGYTLIEQSMKNLDLDNQVPVLYYGSLKVFLFINLLYRE